MRENITAEERMVAKCQARPQLGDIVTWEPTQKPNLRPWTEYLGHRWIVVWDGNGVDRIRAVCIDGDPANSMILTEKTNTWRVLETATHTPVPEPLPTVRGAVIEARFGANRACGVTDVRLATLIDPPHPEGQGCVSGYWLDNRGEGWIDQDVVIGPDYRVVSTPRPWVTQATSDGTDPR
jgi:hypothetical protein